MAAAMRHDIRFPWLGMITIALAVFLSVTSEFLPAGLLPDIAGDLGQSESRIGLLVTVFAATVVLTAAPLTALTRRFSRKGVVLVVLVVFAIANVIAGLAPSFEVLLIARVLGGLAHGLFWAVVSAYSAHLVPRHQLSRAVAVIGAGGSSAFVLGIPVGTALGQAFGWRTAFVAIGAVIVLLIAMVVRFLPPVDHRVPVATGEVPLPMHRDRSLGAVLVISLGILIAMTGQHLFYTFIVPYLTGPAGLPAASVAPLLLLFGLSGAAGLGLAGYLGSRSPGAAIAGALAAVVLVLVPIALWPTTTWLLVGSLIVQGVAIGMVPPLAQTRLLHAASPRIRDLAAALLTTSFNVGIGGGALIGAVMLDSFGLDTLPWGQMALISAAFVLAIGTERYLTRVARAAGGGAGQGALPH